MRRPSIDLLRGFVIILMALDHCQFYWYARGLTDDGLGGYVPEYASAAQQITRFLGHLCAPTFLFLAGMMMSGKKDRRHFFIRGAILILLQFTLEDYAWGPALYRAQGHTYFGILSCLGISMWIVALLSRFRPVYTLVLGLAGFFAMAVLEPTVPSASPWVQALAIATYAPSLVPTMKLTSLFPVFPWFGFLAIGYFVGSTRLQARFVPIGFALIASAFVLRCLNGFGNLIHWHGRPFGSEFFILSKYPPSLVFSLFTLGLVFLLLATLLRHEARLEMPLFRPLLVFGQASLFFYLAHLYIYGSGSFIEGGNVGVSLLQTWEAWALGLIPLYYLCRGYRVLKLRYPHSPLRYI